MPIGTKLMVFRGQAHKTSGGLTKGDLMVNRRGKVVSKNAHAAGKIAFKRNNLTPKTKEEMKQMRGGKHLVLNPHSRLVSGVHSYPVFR